MVGTEMTPNLSSPGGKADMSYIEKTARGVAVTADPLSSDDEGPQYDEEETKKIMRKIDWRLLPVLALLYLLAFLDRGNIGNAKVAGMNTDLKLSGNQYNLALTVFFLTYASLEVPSNIILKLFKRPSRWIAILMLGWGIVMMCMGIVKNYHELLVARVFLGVFESGFFPAATYLLTTWYTRWEVQTRLAVFFTMASMAGAFSGLLAFALAKMDGLGGLQGWRWIFVIEGLVTVVVAFTVPWILPDSPQLCSWLTADEKEFIDRRLAHDSGTKHGKVQTHEGYSFSSIKSALLDWKIWFCCLIYNSASITLYGFTYTAPTIITELGYSGPQAQLLTIPLYIAGVISTIVFSLYADKKRIRWHSIVIPLATTLVGFIGLIAAPHPGLPGLTYGLLFLIPIGVYPPVVSLISWVGNNLAPTWKRAVGMGLLITLGNFGGAVGSNIFLQNEKPHYWTGYGFCIAMLVVGITATFVLRWVYLRENKKRDTVSVEEVRARYTEEELLNMGDRSPLYRYVL